MIRLVLAATSLLVIFGGGSAQAAEQEIYANTSYVEDIAVLPADGRVYAATRGGVEAYDLGSKQRVAHFTTEHGLPTLHIRKLAIEEQRLVALSREHRCVLDGERFQCTKVEAMANTPFSVAGKMGGSRIVRKLAADEHTLVATAGAGLWLGGERPERLTPVDQICSNHMMAIADFAGRTYFGSFDEGLCSTADGKSFRRHEGGFKMINDLEATSAGLFVAASEGLFRSKDGTNFEQVTTVTQRGVNGLAFDGRSLWVTTPGALWRVRIKGGPKDRQYWLPGGARSLQAVAARHGQVWVASEDRGLVRMVGNRFEVFDRAAGMPASWFLDVAIGNDGTAYGATLRDGIVAVAADGEITEIAGAPDDWTLFVHVDSRGLAIGTQGGAAIVKGGAVSTMEGLPHPNVHIMSRAGRAMYIGTEGGTLAIWP